MKNIILILSFFLGTASIHAQTMQITKNVFVGKSRSGSQSIAANVYSFNREKPFFQIDSIHNYMFILTTKLSPSGKYLTNNGYLYMLDLNNSKELWNKKINFLKEGIKYCSKGILFSKRSKTSLLDLKNGETRWTEKFTARETYAEKGLVLAYQISARKSIANTLKGVDIETGNLLWETKLDYKNYWDEVRILNDSCLLIVSDGLHAMNVYNGSGWDYQAKISSKDYKAAVARSAIGVAAAIFIGFGFIDTGPTLTTNLKSNILTKDSAIYMANHETIAKLDHQGQIQWETKLPEPGSASFIHLQDDSLFMLNFGTADRNERKVSVSCPYLACFHKNTGTLLFFNQLAKNGYRVIDYIKTYNGTYLMLEDGVCQVGENNRNYAFKPWNTESNGKLAGFISYAYLYDSATGSFRETDCSKEGTRIVFNEERDLFEVNENFEILCKPSLYDLLTRRGKWKNITLMSDNYSKVYFFDEQRNILAELDIAPRRVKVYKDKLFIISTEEKLYEIDLNQLRNNYFLNTK